MKVDLHASMFASSPQPFVLLDDKARLIYANSAAKPLVNMLGKHRLLWLREILRIAESPQDSPCLLSAEMLPPEAADWDVWLSMTDAAEFALWFMARSRESAGEAADAAGLNLIGQRMREEMTDFARMLNAAYPELVDRMSVPVHFDFMARSRRLSELFDDVAMLSELQEQALIQRDERIYLYALVNEVIGNLDPLAESGFDWQIDSAGLMLAPVYGNRHWLMLGLRAYLRCLMASRGEGGGSISVQFQQIGGCAIVSCRVRAHKGAPARARRLHKQSASDVKDYNLKLLLAERVLNLHGADVKLSYREPRNQIVSFSIAFPTSFPYAAKPDVWCQECPALGQSLAFARDLAALNRSHRNG